jgi:NAD(P)-dependent dehydrogenase (short-subunit alcohol dehydrogenase family)
MQRTIVITGANRGIGFSLAKVFHRAGHSVFAVCRVPSAQLIALNVQIIDGVDVSQTEDIERLAQKLSSVSIDVLINNAGVLSGDQFGLVDYDNARWQFEVNALGPLRVTEALSDKLSPGSKVALITSRMGSIADNTSGRSYGYRMSKAALNAAGMSLHHDLKPREIAVGIFHPGFVQTEMVNGHGDISADQCAERLLQRITELNLHNSGSFWHSNGEVLPW